MFLFTKRRTISAGKKLLCNFLSLRIHRQCHHFSYSPPTYPGKHHHWLDHHVVLLLWTNSKKKKLIHIKKTCPHTKNPHPDPIDWSFQLEATPVSDIRSNCFGKWVPVARIEIWILAAHLFRSCIKKTLEYICIYIYLYHIPSVLKIYTLYIYIDMYCKLTIH